MFTLMLENTILYLMELLKCFLSCIFILRLSFQHKTATLITALLSVFAIFNISACFNIATIPYGLIPLAIIFLFMSEKKKFGLVIMNYFICCIIDVTFCSVIFFLLDINIDTMLGTFQYTLLSNSFSLVVVILLSLIFYMKGINKSMYHIPTKYILLLSSGIFALTLYISFFQVLVFNDDVTPYLNYLALAVSLCSLCFLAIILILIKKQHQNQLLKKEAEINQRLLKTQENYYTMLLEKENETKAFRHDMQHHIYAMYVLFDEQKYSELGDYLSHLNTSLLQLKPVIQTGNN